MCWVSWPCAIMGLGAVLSRMWVQYWLLPGCSNSYCIGAVLAIVWVHYWLIVWVQYWLIVWVQYSLLSGCSTGYCLGAVLAIAWGQYWLLSGCTLSVGMSKAWMKSGIRPG